MRDPLDAPDGERWALILAGGQGVRLPPLTRAVVGDERTKQFCPLLGRDTLLEQTRRRAALEIPPARILVSLTRSHEQLAQALFARPPARVIATLTDLDLRPEWMDRLAPAA